MVKAVLLQSQFPVAKGLAVANAAETPYRAGRNASTLVLRHQSAWNGPCEGTKETNGAPKRIATPRTRNYGIACSRSAGPVWRRSRHSTRMPGVMAGTAVSGSLSGIRTDMRIRPGDRTESASDRGKDDAAKNGMCTMRRNDSVTERYC